ncbi:MAG: hypothetical protein DRI77_09740, partial [Chloroflexi bacterium]
MTQSLIAFDTDRIKDYVFATGRLTEIRGASALLEELNLLKTEETIHDVCPSATVVYCNGGSALAVAPTTDVKIKHIITAVEALYRRETVTATISGADILYDPNRPFGEQVREAAIELRQVKDEKPREARVPVTPWLRICDACGQHPASCADGDQFICKACRIKRQKGKPQRNVFWQGVGRTDRPGFLGAARQAGDHRWRDEQLPVDLDDIGAVSSPPGYVGFLYADVNSMGKKLETLKTRDEYAEFADKADKLIRDVVHQALRRQAQPRSVRRREIAPFEILLMGGDDLMLVTAGDLAVSVALDIVDSYERHAPHDLTLSLGLVLAHARFPIYAMHDLAAALLKSAKKVGGSALDFAVITAVGSRDLEWLRDEALTDRSFALKPPKDWRYRLTQRPYSLADFAKLCYHARQLQAVRFPRSQLQAM